MKEKIRTRYAPSPTGYFHVGGARTALFCYLFAKHFDGSFILRIEDTDQKRNVSQGIKSQYDNLVWLGLKPDESLKNPGQYGPYIQSEKYERYKLLVDKLIKEKKAYYCFCTKEELQEQRKKSLSSGQTPKYNRKCLKLSEETIKNNLSSSIPFVVRLKINDGVYKWNDLIRGEISVPSEAMTDPVLWKSNGTPMYNFAVVIDDYDMKITHVLRGEEHISNTPYQLAIKQALGFDNSCVLYGHLPIIIDEQGKKLSKRNKSIKQFIEDYKIMGFLPSSIINFLALIGWSPKEKKEIMDEKTLINSFDLSGVSKSPAMFDFNKMLWVGKEHMKSLNDDEYFAFVKNFITIDLTSISQDQKGVLVLFKNQISYASQLNSLISECFLNKGNRRVIDKTVLENFKILISSSESLTPESVNVIIKSIQKKLGVSGKNLYSPIRIALTGCEHGPELNKIISVLGKEKILDILNSL